MPFSTDNGFDRQRKQVVAFVNGRRTDANCRALQPTLAGSHISIFYTDDWQSYHKCLPAARQRVGKDGTLRRCALIIAIRDMKSFRISSPGYGTVTPH